MTVIQSSLAIAAELQALLTSLSSGATLVFRDGSGTGIASGRLATTPGVIVGSNIVLLGPPQFASVSSATPVGDIPLTCDIQDVNGNPIITGIAVIAQTNFIAVASSSVNPGGQLGVIGGAIAIP